MKDKIALVTGGTSGIGKKIVEHLLKENVFVYVNYGHNEEQMEKARKDFAQIRDSFEFIKADVSNENEVIEMLKIINDKSRKLDYLVNNAGTNIDSFIENADMIDYKKIIDVNLVWKSYGY